MKNMFKGLLICVCVSIVFYVGVFFVSKNISDNSSVSKTGNSVTSVAPTLDDAKENLEKFDMNDAEN